MKQKRKNILKWFPSVIAGLLILVSASMKLASMPQLVEVYSQIGLVEYIKILGVAELLFVIAFLISRTMKLGFLLLTAYFGGAMAVELSHGNIFIFPAIILTLIWIAAFLRDPSIFKPFQKQKQLLSA
ncbi:MAG TPA: DoxX family protein [Chitinophagaceae bacterium]|nr:DoxX family protein [Chitinophagaceae bacterium]